MRNFEERGGPMSKFYTEISKYYDYIFPTGKAQLQFIKKIVGEAPKNILDVACGSGGYAKSLNDSGHQVTAIDLDPKMVQALKARDTGIDARVLNMLDIEVLNKTFDLIFCIGNSVVHLNNNEEIYEFLKSCKNSLNENGHLLIQVVNYDRVLAQDVKQLPTIENDDVPLVFERYYDYLPEQHKINFRTILKVNENTLENSVLLHPIKSTEFVGLLEELGFQDIQLYGSFNQEAYDPMVSFPLIIVAKK